MNILHLSAAGKSTGAGKAALLTHHTLLSLEVSSRILFLKADTYFEMEEYSYYNLNKLNKIKQKLVTFFERVPLFLYPNRNSELFSPALLGLNIKSSHLFKWADIIHIHWANHGFINLREIKDWGKPVVWTIRDLWPITGGCHHSFECKKFQTRCEKCPVLASKFKYDLSYFAFNHKKKNFKKAQIHWVAISNWIFYSVLNSNILKNNPVHIIPSGIDSERFIIKERISIRKKLNLPVNQKIILIGAANLREKYKGFDFVKKVLSLLGPDIFIITFGTNSFKNHELEQKFFHFGEIKNSELLSEIYNAADIFLGPSIAEALGKTFIEAQLCGIPVICFKDTGPEDIVEHKRTGYCANYKDVKDLVEGVSFTLSQEWDRNYIRERAKSKFDIKKNCDVYISLYSRILQE